MTRIHHSILIVVYKREISNVTLLNALRKSIYKSCLTVTIWDNGPISQACDASLKKLEFDNLRIRYFSTPENLPLSKIYNIFLRDSLQDCNNSLLHFFDQDSLMDDNYFLQIRTAYELHKHIELFLPKVLHENVIVSPLKKNFGLIPTPIKSVGTMASKDVLFVNSGTCFRADFFKKTGFSFDERLKFYGTDTQIAIYYASLRKEIYVLEFSIEHNLFFNERRNTLEAKNRAREVVESIRLVYGGHESNCKTNIRILFFLIKLIRTNGLKAIPNMREGRNR